MKLDRDTMRFMAELNKTLDENYQKLSDKYHDLELSHNRKKRALLNIVCICEEFLKPAVSFEYETNKEIDLSKATVASEFEFKLMNALQAIYVYGNNALFCDGRVNTCLKRKSTTKNSKKSVSSSNR